ncbi:amidase [Enemella sp. A6]|uniref:amidase n=1 Tax=Enemella sp. A6 TaxID=3440152 RepID=UPI003EBA823A
MSIEELDATALAAEIRAGRISAREAVEGAIERIEGARELNAVVHERFDQALAEVDDLPEGPLTGVPTLVKDLGIQVAGLPLTNGSRLFAEQVSEVDSHLVTLFRRAGLVILGSTNTPELGRNGSTEPLLYGPTRNPWNQNYSTGGSSGGSAAAVAAGLVPVAHANDGGGSIRLPASMCGLVGLKPSRGRVSSWPSPSVFSSPHSIGLAVTRTVRDSALLLNIASQRRPGDGLGGGPEDFLAAASTPPGKLRIGWSTTMVDGSGTDPEVAAAVEQAAQLLTELGHEVTEARPKVDVAMWQRTFVAMMRADLQGNIRRRLDALGRELREDDLEPFTHQMYRGKVTMEQYQDALRDSAEIGWQAGEYFNDYDLWLSPTVGARVPELGVLDTRDPEAMMAHAPAISRFTSLFNMTGQPGISVPFGFDDNGLPIGIQLVADTGGEGRLLSVAAQIEQARPWPQIVTDRSFR